MSNKLTILRNSTQHVMTMAMEILYGDKIKKAMGPSIDDGFYFDFDSPKSFSISERDFSKIEKQMQKLIDLDLPITVEMVSKDKAEKIFAKNRYKLHWIKKALETDKKIRLVIIGKEGTDYYFPDVCKDEHLKSTKEIKAFKLLSVAGAYWQGDEKNKMLTRVYGTAFETKKELRSYLNNLEEAKKRDHRKLGKELNLFAFSDMVGKGLPLFTQKGATIWRELERFIVDEEIKRGYQHVRTPNIAKTELYKTSGHYPYYKNTMYPPMKVDDEELILRPMTCPHHFALYQSQPRSYKDLPLRFAELASLYRYEKSGELTGLIRVREFCLADSHNFVRKQDAAKDVSEVLDLIEDVSKILGLIKGKDFVYRLSLGDRSNKEKYYHDPKEWIFGEKLLKDVLVKRQAPFYEAKDEAAFYGPKIDVQMKNVLGKEDTAFTVQYDFCLPKRFNLEFTNEKGEPEQPVVIHRSSVGAMERSIGFLIEHYAGAFPIWLSPVQIVMVPITDKQNAYAKKLAKLFDQHKLRYELDTRSQSMQARIRDAEMQKVPYVIIVGEKEVKANKLAIRQRKKGDLGLISPEKFIEKITTEIEKKTIN